MNLKKSHFISISITPTLVKAAQVTSSGVVEKIAKQDVDKGAAHAALKQILAGFKAKGAAIICAVPGDVATAKNLEVPAVDPEEIESILALQASRHTPFNKDEVLTGYIKLGSPKPNFTRVLLIIVKRETVKEKLDIFKNAGVAVDTVIFVPEAITRFYARGLNIRKTDAPLAFIDVGLQGANFIIESQGMPVMTRNIPVGLEHLACDADAGKQLVEEIKASVQAYEQEGMGAKLSKAYLTTSHMGLAGLDALIGEALGVKVESAPYTKYFKAGKDVLAKINKDFADDPALDVIAAGVAAARCQAELIPQEIKDQRSVVEKGRETLKAGVFVLLILAFLGGGLLSKVYFKDMFLKQNLIVKNI